MSQQGLDVNALLGTYLQELADAQWPKGRLLVESFEQISVRLKVIQVSPVAFARLKALDRNVGFTNAMNLDQNTLKIGKPLDGRTRG